MGGYERPLTGRYAWCISSAFSRENGEKSATICIAILEQDGSIVNVHAGIFQLPHSWCPTWT